MLREETITGFFPAQCLRITVKGKEEQPAELHLKPNICLIGQLSSNKEEFSPFAALKAEIRHLAGRERPSHKDICESPLLVYL